MERGLVRALYFKTGENGRTEGGSSLTVTGCSKEVLGEYYEMFERIEQAKFCIDPRKQADLLTFERKEDDIYFDKAPFEANSNTVLVTLTRGKDFIPGFEEFYVAIISVQHILDEKDFNNPIKAKPSNTAYRFMKTAQTKLQPFYRRNTLITDKGWLFGDSYEEEYIQTEIVKEVVSPISQREDEFILSVELGTSTISKVNYREYLKIPGLLANFGGVVNVFSMIFGIIMRIYSEFVVFDFVWRTKVKKEEKNTDNSDNQLPSGEAIDTNLEFWSYFKEDYLFYKPSPKIKRIYEYLELKSILKKPVEISTNSRFERNRPTIDQ